MSRNFRWIRSVCLCHEMFERSIQEKKRTIDVRETRTCLHPPESVPQVRNRVPDQTFRLKLILRTPLSTQDLCFVVNVFSFHFIERRNERARRNENVPLGRCFKHSNVISNWNGFVKDEGLSNTFTSRTFTSAIFFLKSNFLYWSSRCVRESVCVFFKFENPGTSPFSRKFPSFFDFLHHVTRMIRRIRNPLIHKIS